MSKTSPTQNTQFDRFIFFAPYQTIKYDCDMHWTMELKRIGNLMKT